MDQDRIKYHFERAKTELDLALSADCAAAARSHVRLSSLHLEQFETLEAANRLSDRI